MTSDTKHIYIVRHGQSRANATRTYEGGESPLTELGIQQAQTVAQRFTNIPVDIVLTSDMVRAEHTGRIIAEHCGVPYEVIGHAHEQFRHKDVYGIPHTDDRVKHLEKELWGSFAQGKNLDGAETFENLRMRAQEVQNVLESRYEQNIVLASHGNFLKFFMYHILLGELLTPQVFSAANSRMRTKNTGITYFTLSADKGWQLHTWNDHAHLG